MWARTLLHLDQSKASTNNHPNDPARMIYQCSHQRKTSICLLTFVAKEIYRPVSL
jgi:hypothetical protein